MQRFDVMLFSSDYLPNIGGVAAHVHELARAHLALGHRVCVLTTEDGKLDKPSTWKSRWDKNDGVPVYRVSFASLPGGLGKYLRLRHAVRHVLGEFTNDYTRFVFHWHDTAYGTYAARESVHACKIFTNHTSGFLQQFDDPTSHTHLREQFKPCDWVIAPSQELADITAAVGYDAQHITYISNGVDCLRFKPDESLRKKVRAELAVSNSDIVILCARRVVPKNGVIDFAHSLHFLGEFCDWVTVLFVGNMFGVTDSYEMETVRAAKKSPLSHRVRFLGCVPNSEIHRLYIASDIAVLPSLKEATSLTGLEAMACGLPLVGTRVGGIPDLIEHGVTGLLVQPGDPRELAQALGRLISNSWQRMQFGEAARKRANERFSWRSVAEKTAEVYDKALWNWNQKAAMAKIITH